MLGLVVTDHVYASYPSLSEGKLAKARAAVVSSVSLARVARDLSLGDALLLGKGEQASGGRDKSSILADGLEAVLGAIYLDGGLDASRAVIIELFSPLIEAAASEPGTEDFKTRLQEHVARSFDSLPHYSVQDDGPDHEKRFYATVTVDGRALGQGEGRSKKEAEQAAAGAAWDFLASEQATERPVRTDYPAEAMK